MKRVPWNKAKVTGDFWLNEQALIRSVTMEKVYERFKDRVDAFKCKKDTQAHVFWDSDVAKWMEAAAYVLAEHPDAELESKMESLIDDIIENQCEDGYFNSYYIINGLNGRFTNRGNHELYCAGHLMEAAAEYYRATGRDRFLRAMCKYADLIEKVFMIEKSAKFLSPGHEEIELALIKLYEVTEDKRYLELSKYFVYVRGTDEDIKLEGSNSIQAHKPVLEQTSAVGHAVRAGYLYSAMSDLAAICGDEKLKETCVALFEDIAYSKMYITGAAGSCQHGEAYTFPYDLPNETAYAETCANLALSLFARRMFMLDRRSLYGDVAERVIYNGFLSGISLDGKKFYYSNPQEINLERRERPNSEFRPSPDRVELFDCSCCPPNVLRFISSIQDFIYAVEKDTVYVQQYITSEADIELDSGIARVAMSSGFPYDGSVTLKYTGPNARIALRVPGWCMDFNGKVSEDGFAYYDVSSGDEISVNFNMKPYLVEADPRVSYDCGRAAVVRGPLVYCMEGLDNGDCLHDIVVDGDTLADCGEMMPGVIGVCADAVRRDINSFAGGMPYRPVGKAKANVPIKVKFIPYYTIENRGTTDMLIWTGYKK